MTEPILRDYQQEVERRIYEAWYAGARNVLLDLSGSGVDGGMLDEALRAVGAERLVWGADVTLCTGWAKLRYLERRLPPADVALVGGGNAQRIFPPGAFA